MHINTDGHACDVRCDRSGTLGWRSPMDEAEPARNVERSWLRGTSCICSLNRYSTTVLYIQMLLQPMRSQGSFSWFGVRPTDTHDPSLTLDEISHFGLLVDTDIYRIWQIFSIILAIFETIPVARITPFPFLPPKRAATRLALSSVEHKTPTWFWSWARAQIPPGVVEPA